ncbi:hypothetical protein TIFTF001_010395 [Ficus carica]|uniref:Macro domain-containing protein n=1 Tax=Ficus carica TaxID=3494 RepID=A0AA88D3D6_FICCA|nr:hypothetical protein TIFTF001_010395 [Ficus carica]
MTSILSRGSRLLRITTPLNHSPFPNHLRRLVSSHRTLRASMADAYGLARFPLSSTSSLVIQRGDLTKWFVDGSSDAIVSTSSLSLSLPFPVCFIGNRRFSSLLDLGFVLRDFCYLNSLFGCREMVNPANERMLGGGGADGAIHRAAGPDLLQACYGVPEVSRGVRCPTGEARITPGFKLPVARVVFTVGPIYNGNSTAEASLRSAYRNSLKVAKENNIQYIAFPAISCGVYGYPYDEAATVAISTIKEFANDIKEVHFVHFLEEVYDVWVNKANELLQA